MVKVLEYRTRGAAAALFRQSQLPRPPREVLLEGPADTGKTRGICEWCHWICENPAYKNIRILWLRQTLVSLRESVQITFETKVLPQSHDLLKTGVSRDHRRHYHYDRTGAHIVLGGLDQPTRTFSQEYDLIIVFEAHEISEDTWELLFRANRNDMLPWQQMVADTNPASELHWLNRRFPPGRRGIKGWRRERMLRLLSRHEDNPSCSEERLDTLRALTGARRKRLYEGLWVSDEGQVWPNFDPATHMIDYELDMQAFPNGDRLPRDEEGVLEFAWCGVGIDWGFTAPGCMQAWGVDADGRIYLLAEVYQQGKSTDWWADRFDELVDEFDIRRGWADSADPKAIALFNDRLIRRRKTGSSHLKRHIHKCQKGDKSVQAGIAVVRDGFEVQEDGWPRIFFCRDTLERAGVKPDPILREQRKALSTVEEIPSYVYPRITDGMTEDRKAKVRKEEKPDPSCADHGCDALRYFAVGAWGRDLSSPEPAPQYPPGTLGDLFDHDKFFPRKPKGAKPRPEPRDDV